MADPDAVDEGGAEVLLVLLCSTVVIDGVLLPQLPKPGWQPFPHCKVLAQDTF
jgi:hypothetical protein